MSDKKLMLEVDCFDSPVICDPKSHSRFGKDGTCTTLEGDIVKLTISRDGESQFGITIGDDGLLSLTDYGHLCYTRDAGPILHLKPQRPWT